MGLLDKLLSGGKSAVTDQNAIGGILEMLNDSKMGGIEGLAGKFSQNQLGHLAESWISTGQNKTVTTTQMNSVLGGEMVKGLAAKLGVSTGTALNLLVKHLPNIVDKLTPNGKVTAGAGGINIQEVLSKLTGR